MKFVGDFFANLTKNLIFEIIATWKLEVKEIFKSRSFEIKFSPKNLLEPSAIPIALITFLVGLGFVGILGFITSFEKEINLLEAGKYFFVIYAEAMISRPFTGIIFDRCGENFVMYPAFIIFGLGLLILSFADK